MENYTKDVPYIVYESEAARHERTEGLMKLMEKAPDEQTRNEIRKLMDRM